MAGLGGSGSGGAIGSSRPNRVFISNLKYETTWQVLKDHMRAAGEVNRADILVAPGGRSKGVGVVEYATAAEAQRAIRELSETNLDGRDILVREDRDAPPPRAGGGGGRGGRGGGEGGRGGRGSPVECHKCGQVGHIQRFCPQVMQFDDAPSIKCHNCGGANHLARDCRAVRQPGGPNSCFRCGGYGHLAAVCPTVGQNQRCHRCKGLGHLAQSCPNSAAPHPTAVATV